MTITNKLIETINKISKEENIVKGKEVNPKNKDAKMFGPFAVQTYADGVLQSLNEILEIEDTPEEAKEIKLLSDYTITKITDPVEIEKHIRVSADLQGQAGINSIKVYSNGEDYVCISYIKGEQVKFIYFPREDSNVGVYCNNNNITSYVTDGKVKIVDGKVYNGSANERAVESYLKEFEKEEYKRKRFNKFLSDELWQLEDKEESDADEPVVKSLNILGYTKYLNFPEMDDHTPYNVIWCEDGKPLGEVCKDHPELKEFIRFSSLSQNGICAMGGRLGTRTENGYELLPVKQFKGSKGKLDISATQGPKTYKQSNYKGRTLVVLAEIKPYGHKFPINLMGNCLATKEAFDSYCSDLTRDKGAEHKCKYPAHKIFVKAGGEIVRVKGATSFINMSATLDNFEVTKNIVVLPPREFSTDGTIETDIEKFKYLCSMADSESELQIVKLKVDGIADEIEAPALWCDIYEDSAHSSVYSLRMKEQNIFYYGAISAMHRNNGWVKMSRAFRDMLDQELLNIAMNAVEQSKSQLVEVDIDDIL